VRRITLFSIFLSLCSTLYAAPNPTGGSGTPGHDNNFTITGTGFGSKISPCDSSAKPAYYVDFEDGTQGSVEALSACGDITLGDINMDLVAEARGSSSRMMKSRTDLNWASSSNGGIVSTDILWPAASAARNGKIYTSIKRKSSRSVYTHLSGGNTQYENWKFWRFWPQTNGSGYPNSYTAQNADSPSSCTGGGGKPAPTVEAGSGSNYSKTQSAVRLPGTSSMLDERLLKYNSANTVGDGTFIISQDGIVKQSRTDWPTDPSASFPAAGLRRMYWQDDPSNLTYCGGSTVDHDVWHDDEVFDYGTYAWSRVLLCNASTLASSTICEYQPATSWSSTSITVKQKFGDLGSSADKYIFVFDNTNDVNATGLLLEAGVGNPAPTISTITVSTASYLGGGTSTATGTGFLASITCTVGGNAATTTLVSSTSLWFTFPAGTSGDLADLVCENTDGQSATLPDSVQYTTAPETPIYEDDDPIFDDGRCYLFFTH
jgi:hypothetical protein